MSMTPATDLVALADRMHERAMTQERGGFTREGSALASLCTFIDECAEELRTRAAAQPQGVPEDGMVPRIVSALSELRAPSHITELRQEYWKAGARAAIAAVNSALTQPPAELGEGDAS